MGFILSNEMRRRAVMLGAILPSRVGVMQSPSQDDRTLFAEVAAFSYLQSGSYSTQCVLCIRGLAITLALLIFETAPDWGWGGIGSSDWATR